MDWTLIVWRFLRLLTITSALAAGTGLLSVTPPLVQGIAVMPGLLVVLVLVVAAWADSSTGCGRGGATLSTSSRR
ncbi:hypothetical protein [Leucobacter sp.]